MRLVRNEAWALLGLVVTLLGCKSRPSSALSARVVGDASMPPGCGVTALINVSGMTPALSVLKRTLEEQGLGIAPLAGVDLARDVRRITLCRLPQAGSARRDYVVAMSGPIPADVLAGVNDLAKNADPPGDVAGATMARDGKVWLGTLVAANAEPQLVVATSRDLLRAALTGVDGRYPLDARASLSFVVNSSEFGLRTDRVPVADVNDVKAISSIVVSVAGDATVLRARFIIGDSAIAGRLATNMRPVVTELARRIVGDGRGPMDVSLEVTGGDMVSSVNLQYPLHEGRLASGSG